MKKVIYNPVTGKLYTFVKREGNPMNQESNWHKKFADLLRKLSNE